MTFLLSGPTATTAGMFVRVDASWSSMSPALLKIVVNYRACSAHCTIGSQSNQLVLFSLIRSCFCVWFVCVHKPIRHSFSVHNSISHFCHVYNTVPSSAFSMCCYGKENVLVTQQSIRPGCGAVIRPTRRFSSIASSKYVWWICTSI